MAVRGKPSLNYIDWYKAIKMADKPGGNTFMDVLANAVDFFEEEQQNAQKVFQGGDKLVDIFRNHVGFLPFYHNLDTQLECIVEHFERKLRTLKGKILSEWDKDPPTNFTLSKADKGYLLEAHPEVQDLSEIIELFRVLHRQFSKIIVSLDSAAFQFSNVTKLRIAGQEEAVL